MKTLAISLLAAVAALAQPTPPVILPWPTNGTNQPQPVILHLWWDYHGPNVDNITFEIFSSTNVSLPKTNWTVIGTWPATNWHGITNGVFTYMSLIKATNDLTEFLSIRAVNIRGPSPGGFSGVVSIPPPLTTNDVPVGVNLTK